MYWTRGRKFHGVEVFSLNINISKVWPHCLLKFGKLCKQDVHFKLFCMQNSMSCKNTNHGDFSLTDRVPDRQHPVEGTAMAGRCAQLKIHSPWFNLPFSTHDFKASLVFLIENLYREKLLRKLPKVFSPSQHTVPLQKRAGTIVSGGTWYTTFLSDKFIKLSSIKIHMGKPRKQNHHSPSMPCGTEI